MKIAICQFWYRLTLGLRIIFSPKAKWVFIRITDEGFRALLTGEGDVDMKYSYHRLQEYNVWQLIQSMGDTKDEIDMMLMKAEFEAKAQEHADKRKGR